MGFVNSTKIEKVFERMTPSQEFSEMEISDWIQAIDNAFSE